MALLDAYEQLGDASCLEMAASAGEYLVKELYYTEVNGVASFSYPLPGLQTKVHNANLLAAALLSRLYHHSGDERLMDLALRSHVTLSVNKRMMARGTMANCLTRIGSTTFIPDTI